MTSLLQENRMRLQQRITQRIRGDIKPLSTHRDIIPQRYIPRRRRRQDDQSQADPFRFQAQEYLYNDVPLTERLMRQASRGPRDTLQLPMLRPRYTDMHSHKGVPNQKYVDIILDRKGPLHRAPSRYIHGAAISVAQSKQYDDSITIKSYRHLDDFMPHMPRPTPDDINPLERIALIAPQKIQYPVQGPQRLYTFDKSRPTSPARRNQEMANIAALKGKKMTTMKTIEEQNEVTLPPKRNLPFLRKVRKRLSSEDQKFVKEIASHLSIKEPAPREPKNLVLRGKEAAPTLPPIRITVTNPLPTNSPIGPQRADDAEIKPNGGVENNSTAPRDEKQKRLPLIKFASTPKEKKKHKKKAKAAQKRSSEDNKQPKSPTGDESTGAALEYSKEDFLSDNGQLMPAPITKITFQSSNEANLRRPKKATNVQVERVLQGDVMATHPHAYRRENAPAVKVSNFEMSDNPHPDIIFRKDGTIGPAPPSTNYVNFQKTTRLGGQSRVLMALRNRQIAVDADEILKNWSNMDRMFPIENQGTYLDETPHRQSENTVHRKLGRIKAMKRSLLAAHKALLEAEIDSSKIEIDTVTDEGRSERSYDSEQRLLAAKPSKSYYVNRLPENSMPNPAVQPPITGFYMGKSNDSYEAQINSKTRSISTQWTSDEIPQGATYPTPLAPPNTALLESFRRLRE